MRAGWQPPNGGCVQANKLSSDPTLVEDRDEAPLCATCYRSCVQALPRRPELSIGSGRHFGERGDLPELTDLEQRLIAPVRSSVNTVKLVPTGRSTGDCQWGIRGHSISIPHEGPEMTASRLPNLGVLAQTKVIFVGKREEWQAVCAEPRTRSKVERIFTVRWDALRRWMRFLKAVNPIYKDIELEETEPEALREFSRTVLDRVSLADDPSVLAAGEPPTSRRRGHPPEHRTERRGPTTRRVERG